MGMGEEIVQIKVTENTFLDWYLKLRIPCSLTPTEYSVFSEIVKVGNFTKEIKKGIRQTMGLSIYSLNNILSSLKKKQLIDHNEIMHTYTSMFKIPKRLDKLSFKFIYGATG